MWAQVRVGDVARCLGEDCAQRAFRDWIFVGHDKCFVSARANAPQFYMFRSADNTEPEAGQNGDDICTREDLKSSLHAVVGKPRNWSGWQEPSQTRVRQNLRLQSRERPRRECFPAIPRMLRPPSR